MVWVWEANYYYCIKQDSLMARVKLAKANESISTVELYFQRLRCQKTYRIQDKLTNFLSFLQKFEEARLYDFTMLTHLNLFMTELSRPMPSMNVMKKNSRGYKKLMSKYLRLLHRLKEKFPYSIKLLELYGTLLYNILNQFEGEKFIQKASQLAKSKRKAENEYFHIMDNNMVWIIDTSADQAG
jgi:hypothetical protein